MRRFHLLLLALLLATSASADQKPETVLRWTEGGANCTLRSADDGHVYYGLSSDDFDVTLSVDRQELEKIRFRIIRMLSMEVSFHVKGTKELEVLQNKFTLEFVKHHQLVENAHDPTDMLNDIQSDIDNLSFEVKRAEKKHPDQKQKQADLESRIKQYKEMSDYISAHALRTLALTPSKSSASGWLFFDINNRWIGSWSKPEQFILRLPLHNVSVEFPFQLPPKGKVTLMHRPAGKS